MKASFPIRRRSDLTGDINEMMFPNKFAKRVAAWMKSVNPPRIQVAFPDMDEDLREFLLTGTTQEEWDAVMGGCNDEDQEELATTKGD